MKKIMAEADVPVSDKNIVVTNEESGPDTRLASYCLKKPIPTAIEGFFT